VSARVLALPKPAPQRADDFVEDYIRYADVIEAPREAHEAIAISIIAAALNKKVFIQHGAIKTSLDLWVLLLSGSGLGRNTLVDLARPILKQAKAEKLVANVTWGSREACYQDIAERLSGLFMWPELSVVLKKMKDARFAGLKEWITDRYDNWNAPEAITYRFTGRTSDTPLIEFSEAPRLNLLATSSYDWFVNNLEQDDSTGGFVPRWIIVRLEDPKTLIPIPRATDKSLVAPLAEHLKQVRLLKGSVDISGVEAMYGQWYRDAHQRFSQQANRALAGPFFNRLRGQVLKLAVVFEVSRSLSLKVSPEAMTRALDFARRMERTIFDHLLPTGMCREGSELDRMEARIKSAESYGLLASELTRAFQQIDKRVRDSRIETLIEGAVVHRFERATAGRKAKVLVHSQWLVAYRKRHSQDTEV